MAPRPIITEEAPKENKDVGVVSTFLAVSPAHYESLIRWVPTCRLTGALDILEAKNVTVDDHRDVKVGRVNHLAQVCPSGRVLGSL